MLVIENILDEMGIGFERGDLSELISNAPDTKRTMDFIIPDKKNPMIIIECSYLVTTSSGQGDKSKTEISIDSLIKEHYPKESSNSKIGETWVSFYLDEIVTIRDIDWEKLAQYFFIPENIKDVDFTKIKLDKQTSLFKYKNDKVLPIYLKKSTNSR